MSSATHNTNTPTRVSNTTLQQTSSPRCLTHYSIGHRGQLTTHYHQTTYPSSVQLAYDMTTNYNKTDGHAPTTRKMTGFNSICSDHHTHQYTHCQQSFHKHHTDGRQHLHDETLTLPLHEYLQLYGSQYKQKTQHALHKHTTYFNTPRLKNPLFLTTAATQQIFPHTPTQSLQQA